MIVDVDNFKTVNDSYGHEQGDMVLREFAVRLRRCGSNHALFSRFGGDEFVLVDMIGKRAELELEENLRRHMRLPDSVPVVTTSIGIAIPSTSRSTDISQVELAGLFRLADAAMYQAKASGATGLSSLTRNCDDCRIAEGRTGLSCSGGCNSRWQPFG